jgi:hypothetical protein
LSGCYGKAWTDTRSLETLKIIERNERLDLAKAALLETWEEEEDEDQDGDEA